MHNTSLVCVFQCIGELPADAERFIDGNRPLADTIGECWSFDQLHRQCARAADLAVSSRASDSVLKSAREERCPYARATW